ncbi:IS701 family transposase [Gordonia sp. LSe1-13]|uniref:IS701 family transposase n=1 Tax=Gordonia sesuvii TaxID=3116777 RepID=A0ABU7MKA2_9ACTN|nr:IS701 family transposase [Gordonia sp. LSe1-13]
MDTIAPRFARHDAARNAGAFLLSVLSALETKNCWTMAEMAGHASPDRLQHLLSRAKWEADDLREDLQRMVIDGLGVEHAVLVVDETGDLKKGTNTVGVQRQYTGTAGRIENSQVAVYLTYATRSGHALIDRALYLPRSWTDDPDRCAAAKVPADVGFATKPELAAQLIARALTAGIAAEWVAGDEVYGDDPKLRSMLAANKIGYVLTVGCHRQVIVDDYYIRADDLADTVPERAWKRLSAGDGAKGQRWYSWARVRVYEPDLPGHHWMLIRRNDTTGELAYYRCHHPRQVSLAALVAVAGRRWTVEESFQSSKGLTGLDQHQVRTWTSWHRWTILVMLAHAFLTVTTVAERARETPDATLIRLSVNEFRRLLIALILTPLHASTRLLDWSRWRRQHQQRARQCHQNRRSKPH